MPLKQPAMSSTNKVKDHLTLIKNLFLRRNTVAPEIQRAMDLIRAVNSGGLPLNPARVNDIARQLGLEVSTKARMEDTISRIRGALDGRSEMP